MIHPSRLENVLPACLYSPTYVVKDFPIARYQGLQFVSHSSLFFTWKTKGESISLYQCSRSELGSQVEARISAEGKRWKAALTSGPLYRMIRVTAAAAKLIKLGGNQ